MILLGGTFVLDIQGRIEFNLTPSLSLQGLRDAVKLGLKAYKSLLAMSTVTKDWTAWNIHDSHGNLLAEDRPCQIIDIILRGKNNEDKITLEIRKMQKVKLLRPNIA